MTWDMAINHEEESHALKLQVYDKDIFSSDELVGESVLDFSAPALHS